MFLATDHVVQHLSAKIDGTNSNENIVDVGMIRDTPRLKIYNVTFSVKMDNINFWIAKRTHYIIAIDAFFRAYGTNTTFHLDSAFSTVCTRCTILSNHTVVGAYTLNDQMIRENFATNKKNMIPTMPVQYENACDQCSSASDGDHCQNCRGDTFKN